jgi:transposase
LGTIHSTELFLFDHLLRKINQVVDFSFVNELIKDLYTPDFGRPAEDPEFMLRLCLLQYLYGDSDREVEENTGSAALPG